MVFVKHLFLFCFLSHQRKCEILESCISFLVCPCCSLPVAQIRLAWLPSRLKQQRICYNAGDLGSVPGSGRSPGEGWQPTPVFLPGESHGRRSLAGYSSWGPKESDTTNTFTFSLLSYKLCCIHFVKLLFKAIHASNVSHALTV